MSSIPLPFQSHSSTSTYVNNQNTGSHLNDDNDSFISNATVASNLLTSLKQPSKMNFNWSRQFNETLATISNMLQRNFHDNIQPSGGNVSEASASTATIGSNTAIDSESFVKKTKNSFISSKKRRRSNFSTADAKELDVLVLKSVDFDDSDSY